MSYHIIKKNIVINLSTHRGPLSTEFFGRMYRRFLILLQGLKGLLQAWIIKRKKNMGNIQIPLTANTLPLDEKEISFAIRYVHVILKFGAIRTGRRCFFRAYIMAYILRNWGIPVMMNVGLCNLRSSQKTIGHCWLTLEGQPFKEIDNPNQKFPFKMLCAANGIYYWVG